MKWSICLPSYNNFTEVYFTVQSLRMYHDLKDTEYNFLFGVAVSLGIDKEIFDSLLDKQVKRLVLLCASSPDD